MRIKPFTPQSAAPLLEKLGLSAVNSGACIGPGGWIDNPGGEVLVSLNPTTNEPIASGDPGQRRHL